MKRNSRKLMGTVIALVIAAGAWFVNESGVMDQFTHQQVEQVSSAEIPEYEGEPYAMVNGNDPEFTSDDMERLSIPGYEYYSELDELGRAGMVEACVGEETMPDGERGSIGMVKPTGWHTVRYDFVDGQYLYNRCHLLGWQLTGENANECNLITGTRSMNVDGMLPFEEEIAEYIKGTGNHVAVRVTPIYRGDDLVARGVQMEAESLEDNSVCFNVFVFDVQDGVKIDYGTGESYTER